eukprot:30060-Pelagococcus_subviridis.AAC.15
MRFLHAARRLRAACAAALDAFPLAASARRSPSEEAGVVPDLNADHSDAASETSSSIRRRTTAARATSSASAPSTTASLTSALWIESKRVAAAAALPRRSDDNAACTPLWNPEEETPS